MQGSGLEVGIWGWEEVIIEVGDVGDGGWLYVG